MPLLIWFTIRHPSTYKDFLPIQRTKTNWIIDKNLLVLYGYVIGIITLGVLLIILLK
jgi:hypothetical protein